MKRNLTLILTFIWTLNYGQKDTLLRARTDIISALSAAIANDKGLFLKSIYNKSAFVYRVTKGTSLSDKEKKQSQELFDISYEKYKEDQVTRFLSIQKKFKELDVKWEYTRVDSISIKADGDDMEETRSGTIYLRKTDNSQFYKMNFQGVLKQDDRYFIETLYVPHIYAGPRNRLLTANIKTQFIDTCLKTINYQMSISDVMKSVYGKCPPCQCEFQYFSETEQDDGVKRVMNYIAAGSFRLPARKK